MINERNKLTCGKCSGIVEPGHDGMITGKSTEPDGHPSGAIPISISAVHYAGRCKAGTIYD